jgi:hypothetical protein
MIKEAPSDMKRLKDPNAARQKGQGPNVVGLNEKQTQLLCSFFTNLQCKSTDTSILFCICFLIVLQRILIPNSMKISQN